MPATTPLFVRRDIWSLEAAAPWDPATVAYAKAVALMRQRDAADPTSWAYQAAMHGSYAPVPPGADWNQCQHGTWFFLSWHRMYLHFFERIVRAAVVSQGGPADWALPYWNYGNGAPGNALPPAFRQPTWTPPSTVDGPRPNPLYTERRAPQVNNGAGLPRRSVSFAYAYGFTNFTGTPAPGFGGGQTLPVHFDKHAGAIENQPHNVVHDLIGGPSEGNCQGGWMSDPNCAALDPIFWLHHGNIDRLWSNWIALGGHRHNPIDKTWLKSEFVFHDEAGKRAIMSTADVLDTVSQLGYKYDDHVPVVARQLREAIVTPAQFEQPPQVVAATDTATMLSGTASTVDIALAAPATRAVEKLVRTPQESRVYLKVEGIQAQAHPGIVYEIFLNLPPRTAPEDSDAYLVGHLTFFGVTRPADGGAAHHAPDGLTHTFDITRLVQHLHTIGEWHDDRMAVTFAPLGLTPPPGPQPEAAPRAASVHPVRIGRIAVFHH